MDTNKVGEQTKLADYAGSSLTVEITHHDLTFV